MSDDELLSATPQAANEHLRAEVLARTTGRIRFARRLRLACRVGICVLCFAAGALTTSLRAPPVPQSAYIEVVVEAPRIAAPATPPAESPPSPAAMELVAEQTVEKAEAARRFREAGDRYLRDAADFESALRCYRYFLDGAAPEDLAVAPDDSWLLTSLKRARAQENVQ